MRGVNEISNLTYFWHTILNIARELKIEHCIHHDLDRPPRGDGTTRDDQRHMCHLRHTTNIHNTCSAFKLKRRPLASQSCLLRQINRHAKVPSEGSEWEENCAMLIRLRERIPDPTSKEAIFVEATAFSALLLQ